ncbi:MAG: hypothetical protein M1816_004532 [Peltula sp. TS41687]|nr:MAG: hypothetical protein M1816_004532 [Peltula sp. TS41687]
MLIPFRLSATYSVIPAPSQTQGANTNNTSYGNSNHSPGMLPPSDVINSLSHPTGPEYQLLVGEGTYFLRDDVHLATPYLHPAEPTVSNPNGLATAVHPPTAGTKLSLVTIAPRKTIALLHKSHSNSSIPPQNPASADQVERLREEQLARPASGGSSEHQGSSENSSARLSLELTNGTTGSENEATPAFGQGNMLLSLVTSKDPSKRRKPKNNIVKSNSSFISRVMLHDGLAKRLQERSPDGLYAFINITRSFQWLDFSASNKADFLTKILFTKAHALSHDINNTTKSSNHLDIILGFSTNDIIWYEPFSQKYSRLNKHGAINQSPISEIRWIPGSENLFLAAHMDGSLVVYDKEKEDAPFVPDEMTHLSSDTFEPDCVLQVLKSVNSVNQKSNPVAWWKLSNQSINSFAFSPDHQHLAAVSEDGTLRIIDYLHEKLLDVYPSYYGGFIAVCWSPDGKYILTGGQDDLVSVWSLTERRIVARCEGHSSWVSGVAFDPWRCDERNYRFGSVGEDCKLLLWDFNVGMLHRPKAVRFPASIKQRGTSISSRFGGQNSGSISGAENQATNRLRSDSDRASTSADEIPAVHHPVEPRAQTARLPPVMIAVPEHSLNGVKNLPGGGGRDRLQFWSRHGSIPIFLELLYVKEEALIRSAAVCFTDRALSHE